MVSYEYFMDELELYELELLLNSFSYSSKSQWEQSRFQTYYTVLPNLDKRYKKKSMKELFPLITDDLDEEKKEELPDMEGIMKVMNKAKGIDIKNIKTEEIKFT